jgi:hypothetical protein
MNIKLEEYKEKGLVPVTHRIISFKKVAEPKSTLLVFKGLPLDDEGVNRPTKDIYKLQFIASCKTTINKEELLVAFYIDNEFGTYDYWVINLPDGFEHAKGEPSVLDYQAYKDICILTGENVRPFNEYLHGYGSIVYNSLTDFGEELRPC